MYVTNVSSGSVSQYSIDVATGALSAKNPAIVSAGTFPRGIAIASPAQEPEATYADLVLGDEPAGYWRFGESEGTTAEASSPNDNDGVYLNGVTLGVPGALLGDLNTAAAFDGVNDLVRVPDADTLDVGDSFTLEGWIKRSSESRTHQMFLKGGQSFQLTVMNAANANQVWLRKANVSTVARSQAGVPADENYHHVVATKDGPDSARIYIDGVQSTVAVSGAQVMGDTTNPLQFTGGNTTPIISTSSRSTPAR